MKFGWRIKLYLFATILAVLPLGFSSFNLIKITEGELISSLNEELVVTTNQIVREINTFYIQRWLTPLKLLKSSLELEDLAPQEKLALLPPVVKEADEILKVAIYTEMSAGNYSLVFSVPNTNILKKIEETGFTQDKILGVDETLYSKVEGKELFLAEPVYKPEINLWISQIIIPVNIQGVPPSYIIAFINNSVLNETIAGHPFNSVGKIYLLDNKYREVYDTQNVVQETNPVVREAVELLNSDNRAQKINNVTLEDGSEIVACYDFPKDLMWVVALEIEQKRAYQTVASMENRMYEYAGVFVVLALIGVFLFSKQIGAPIKKLTGVASEVSKGNFDIKVDYSAKDEIGFLGRTLEDMSKSLKASFSKIEKQNKELEDYSHTLEDKVEERTIELKNKNEELHELLEKLKRTQDQLITQEKLASLGALTAGIAHEIQNPLNFVNNFSHLSIGLVDELNEEIEDLATDMSEEDKKYVDEIMDDIKMNVQKINEHGKRAESIVKNMLQHSRGDAGDFQQTDLAKLLDENFGLAYHATRNDNPDFNVEIKKEYSSELDKVNINPQAFGRVVLNIINNALYAMNEKMQENKDYKPAFSIVTKADKENYSILLRDNGPGIPESALKKIFEPFYTTKPTGKGTGLGLSLSYDIVSKMHGGSLTVNTEKDKFTEFVITVPYKK